jgi:hypothetical protein
MPIVYAQDIKIDLAKNNYNLYETLQADIVFNLSLTEKITASNFGLIDKYNETIPISIFLEKLSNNNYYVYFNIPKLNSDTYYFMIKDIKYLDNILKITSKKNEFYLNNLSSVSIFPGIFNNKTSGNLKIINNGYEKNITLTADKIGLSEKIILKNDFNINLNFPKNIEDFNIRLDYENNYYLIPVYTYKEQIKINNFNLENKTISKNENKSEETINKKELNGSIILLNSTYGTNFNSKFDLKKESIVRGHFYIKNNLNYDIKNVELSLTGNIRNIIKLYSPFIPIIGQNETVIQYIKINENQNPDKLEYKGKIEIKSNNTLLTYLPFEINFIEKNLIKNNLTNLTDLKQENKKDNKIQSNKINNQQQINKAKSNKKIIIIFILFIVFIIIGFIYYLMKKPKSKTFDEFLNKK